nr:MBOAT family O-acyltransferase [Romboutsia weinsteinii]
MIGSISFNYIFGIKVSSNNLKEKKLWLNIAVIFNISILVIFKYSNFFVDNINTLFGTDINIQAIALPLGISFFTFQTMSYVIDVYKKDGKVQRNIFDLALYISLFPQLVAGPIVRYQTVDEQINKRTYSSEKFAEGVNRFVCGLAKKVILSNQLGLVADGVFSASISNLSVVEAWVGITCYTLQIYFDFGGYSDMAIGLGKMFGFDFLENFNYPYISQSVSEFWRRWHISLGSWFRDYVYIPLGGSRVSKLKLYRNLFVVWFLTGFWHGASWNFIIWGLYFGILIALEKAFLEKLLYRLPRFVRHTYLLLVVILGWVFFRSTDILQAFEFIQVMFGLKSNLIFNSSVSVYLIDYYYIIFTALILSTPIVKVLKSRLLKLNKKVLSSNISYALHGLLLSAYMLIVVVMLCSSSYNPFLYFRF